MGYDGKSPIGLQKKGIVEPLQLELVPKKLCTKGLGFKPLRLGGLGSHTTLQITNSTFTNDQKHEKHYSIDSNESHRLH